MSAPKLLLDENLSPRLVQMLAGDFPDSLHVDQAGLHGCPDGEVWLHARNHDLVLVSKDNDFRQMSFLRGAPPKVIWLRIGNCPTSAVAELLQSRKAEISSFVADAESALLVLQGNYDFP